MALFFEVIIFLLFEPLGVDLSSQADLPTFKNLDFVSTAARFMKNQGF